VPGAPGRIIRGLMSATSDSVMSPTNSVAPAPSTSRSRTVSEFVPAPFVFQVNGSVG
jgi:hypothetical protein